MDTSLAKQFDRLPPNDADAEKCLLASLMLAESEAVFEETRAGVTSESFFSADNGIIFNALSDMFDRRQPVDAILLANELTSRGLFEGIGGNAYLGHILDTV